MRVSKFFTLATFDKSPNRRISLNIIAHYARSLYALASGLFIGRRLLAAGKSEFGLRAVVGGMTVIELLAYTMRSVRGRIAAVGNENYCGNLLW